MRRARCAHWVAVLSSALGVTFPGGGPSYSAPPLQPRSGAPHDHQPVSPIPAPTLPAPVAFATPGGAFEPSGPPIRLASLEVQPPPPQPDAPPPPEPPPGEGEIEIPFTDEPFELDIPPEIGRLQSVVVRPRAMAETQVFTPPPAQGPPFLAVIGKRKGKAEITLIGDQGARKYRFRWVPSLRDMESILLHQFPNSSLRLTQVADNIIIVEGAVDSAAEIQPILTLLENFLTRGGTNPRKVVNAMQVVGPMQVQLEVMIARVDRARLRQLGFNFTQSDGPWYSGSQVGNIINTPPINAPIDSLFPFPGAGTLPGSSTMTGASTLFLGLADDSRSFGAYVEALEQQNAIKVLARPVLVTMSGRPAEFLNGGEQPYVTVAGVSQNPDVQFKKFGTQLNFVPVIMGQGKIRLDLAPSVSSIDESSPSQLPGSFLPLVIKQSMHASVEMESGQTLIMGGMYQTTTESVIRKVPCLGDLWLIGPAFRRVSHVQREQELMVLVTPRLVHPLDCHQVPPCVPGDETRTPTDCELYFHGLPEVDNCFGTLTRPAHGGFPAPLQYHQWEPLVPGEGMREALPVPHPQASPPIANPPAAAHRLPQPQGELQPPRGQFSGFPSQPGSIR